MPSICQLAHPTPGELVPVWELDAAAPRPPYAAAAPARDRPELS